MDESNDLDDCDVTCVASRAELMAARTKSRSIHPYLMVVAGSTVGRLIRVGAQMTLGRSPDVDIRLDEEGVSRRHAALSALPDGAVEIRDLGSRNGTLVNDEPIERRVLRDGDRVFIGGTTILKFSYRDVVEEALQRNLYDSATRDALTGAHNRRWFDEAAGSELAYARRHDRPLSLIMVDKLRIGEVLIEEGLASAEDVERALDEQKRRRGRRLGAVLVEMGIVDEATLTGTLAKKFDMQCVDLDALPEPHCDATLTDLVRRFGVLPLESDSQGMVLAIADPLAMDAVDAFRFHTKKRIVEVIARPSQLARAVERYLERVDLSTLDGRVDEILQELGEEAPSSAESAETKLNEADSGVIKLVNQILLDAVRRGASDIHIEPNGRSRPTVVRFRIDGECVPYQEIPAAYRAPLVSRLKVMARLDLAERRKPQDGKIRFATRDRTIELRMATLPTVDDGEDVVLRILAGSRPMPIESCGFSERDLREVRRAITQPYGLVLCVGPTGSGKTTTLHSLLGAINTNDMKIWTAEDPVEITQPGLRQVQVQPKIGMGFANVLRAFLRADPDVIMVGEMRDLETASIAVEASLTGHLVFSTLHTNSAAETVTRLVDMGLDPFVFSDALLAVIAQRLVRTLCRACREPVVAGARERSELAKLYGADFEDRFGTGPITLHRPKGCAVCHSSGYKGRAALHEVLVADDGIRGAIQRKQTAETMRHSALAGGMTTLLQAGIARVLAGETDLGQVLSVCSR